jgi:hypothetical protein
VNPSVLGGLVVDFGEKTIDLSVSSRINKLNGLLQRGCQIFSSFSFELTRMSASDRIRLKGDVAWKRLIDTFGDTKFNNIVLPLV